MFWGPRCYIGCQMPCEAEASQHDLSCHLNQYGSFSGNPLYCPVLSPGLHRLQGCPRWRNPASWSRSYNSTGFAKTRHPVWDLPEFSHQFCCSLLYTILQTMAVVVDASSDELAFEGPPRPPKPIHSYKCMQRSGSMSGECQPQIPGPLQQAADFPLKPRASTLRISEAPPPQETKRDYHRHRGCNRRKLIVS